jgi:hypothetical protein
MSDDGSVPRAMPCLAEESGSRQIQYCCSEFSSMVINWIESPWYRSWISERFVGDGKMGSTVRIAVDWQALDSILD